MLQAIDIKTGLRVKHIRTQGEYYVIDEGLMKNGDGEWVKCVMYRKETNGEIFARDTEKFINGFEPLL